MKVMKLLFGADVVLGGAALLILSSPISAITFQDSVDVQFSFDVSLGLTLSSDILLIDGLSPGNSAHSNTISVDVMTNNVSGYTLSARVGGAGQTAANNSLVDTATNAAFTSLGSDASLILTQFGSNQWGYTTSITPDIIGSTQYSGLSYGSDKTINATTTASGTAVAGYPGTNLTRFTIGAKAADDQLAGNYSNVITFTVVGNAVPIVTLYDMVAAMSKGTQTRSTVLTSTVVTVERSGVYEYDAGVFGVASDAANTHKIYYYRGILDSDMDGTASTYGSAGDGALWPNYVILDADGTKTTADTCWRIVRTTGSGGVKMIYNGKWTGSTCANAQANAQVGTSTFNGVSNPSSNKQFVRVGYTYNSAYASNTETDVALGDLVGTNDTAFKNDTDSDMKAYLENTWFSEIQGYRSLLEPSAGYCNDRAAYSGNTLLGEDALMAQYTTSTTQAQFAAGKRLSSAVSGLAPTLGCGRSVVDLYTTSDAQNGNGQLKEPVALLTVDELRFAGGINANASSYDIFLRSGNNYRLLSPYTRFQSGNMEVYSGGANGTIDYSLPSSLAGVRPVISLIPGIIPADGDGTAADPWVVTLR